MDCNIWSFSAFNGIWRKIYLFIALSDDDFAFDTELVVPTNLDNPTNPHPEYGDYTLMYTGCDTSILFNVLFMCDLEIPNTFSPNDDAYGNNLFTIEDLTYEFYSYSNMSIYNRWGDEVYKNGHYGLDGSWWDGKVTHQYDELVTGVYFYVLKVTILIYS